MTDDGKIILLSYLADFGAENSIDPTTLTVRELVAEVADSVPAHREQRTADRARRIWAVTS